METNREKVRAARSLLCLLQGLRGYQTTVELRKEDSAFGTITHVDGFMNIQMTNCLHTKPDGTKQMFEYFFIHGVNVRYVHIPDEINMARMIHQQINLFYGKRQKAGKRKDKNLTKKFLTMKEQKEKRKQTLMRMIEETKRKLGISEDVQET